MATEEPEANGPQQDNDTSQGSNGRDWKSVQTVTAFIDLLGVANALRDLDRIHDEDLDKEAATPLVVEAIGRVMRFRQEFISCMKGFEIPPPEFPPGLPEDAKAVFEETRQSDRRFHAFSDCIVVNIVVDKERLLGTARDMLLVCQSLIFASLSMLSQGVLVRGGIETGLALDDGSSEVLGSGLAHAYELESKIAEYPRICVGPRFMGLLAAMEHEGNREGLRGRDQLRAELVAGTATMVRSLIVTDLDGIPRLRLVLPEIIAISEKNGVDITTAVRQAIDPLGANPTKNSRHLKKLVWARNTFEAELRQSRS